MTRTREILVAKNSGFCFGVKRAVDMALQYRGEATTRVRTLGPLIHNNDVIERLEANHVHQIAEEDLRSLAEDDVVVIRSHGVTPDVIARIENSGAVKLDATCPFVSTIHRKVAKHHQEGYQIVIVGDKDHPEVVGIHGWCNNAAIITRTGDELVGVDLPSKVCVVAQTTERQENFNRIVEMVSQSDRDVLAFNTICNATRERQQSTEEVSAKVDAMVVIGGRSSSNTKKLYEISQAHCERTVFVENRQELPAWLWEDPEIRKIGVTAGASTPSWIISEVMEALSDSQPTEGDISPHGERRGSE